MNIAYILILFAHVGPMGQGSSNALTTAGFESYESCRQAGKAAQGMPYGKAIEFICVKK